MKIIIFLFRDLIERHSEFNFVTGPQGQIPPPASTVVSCLFPYCSYSPIFPWFSIFPGFPPNNLSISRSLSLHNYRRSFICNFEEKCSTHRSKCM